VEGTAVKKPALSPPDALPANVDPREAAHYARLAHTWWDCAGPFWPLHRLNTLRTGFLREVLANVFDRDANSARPMDGLSVLDVGCGGGILSESIAGLGAQVHGIDVVDKNIAVAQQHARDGALDVRYEVADTASLCRREARYDVVLNMEVVEHVPHVPSLVHECANLLHPSGVLVVATINRTLLSWLFAIIGAEHVLRWLPRGTHRWRRFVTPAELWHLLATEGLVPLTHTGVRVNPLTRHFSLSHHMAVNYMLVSQRLPSAQRASQTTAPRTIDATSTVA
jgi:2-polyprenyl-6-hydroxyphenyl methylase/3-demethylubiquinone-9 3-methyltransferase